MLHLPVVLAVGERRCRLRGRRRRVMEGELRLVLIEFGDQATSCAIRLGEIAPWLSSASLKASTAELVAPCARSLTLRPLRI